jgi:hypothetical protein
MSWSSLDLETDMSGSEFSAVNALMRFKIEFGITGKEFWDAEKHSNAEDSKN